MDLVFLLDGSYSVGKGSFERSRHYATRLSRVLDIRPDKVVTPSFQLLTRLYTLMSVCVGYSTMPCSPLGPAEPLLLSLR